MLRFLFTRRWIGLFLVAVLVGVACVELGLWQFRRYTERKELNTHTVANLNATPVPLDQVITPDSPANPDTEFTVVTATGTYDPAHTVTVRYRTRDSQPGVDVVVPLVTSSGTAVLVDRGWVSTPDTGAKPTDIPAPPTGTVTVTGWARLNGTGSETEPVDSSVRAISSTALTSTMPYPLYDGFLDLRKEDPPVKPAPALAAQPDLSTGPHFFYGLQWFFFAMLAFGFWGYFAWTEYQHVIEDARPTLDPAGSSPNG